MEEPVMDDWVMEIGPYLMNKTAQLVVAIMLAVVPPHCIAPPY
jgi:hypothetical protein